MHEAIMRPGHTSMERDGSSSSMNSSPATKIGVGRWIYRLTQGGSLALCLLVSLAWVRSFWVFDGIIVDAHWAGTQMSLFPGGLYGRVAVSGRFKIPVSVIIDWTCRPMSKNTELSYAQNLYAIEHGHFSSFGFALGPGVIGLPAYRIPSWFLLGGPWSAFVFLIWMGGRRRKRQNGDIICANCGYILRAHNPGDRCPECGAPKPPAPCLPCKV